MKSRSICGLLIEKRSDINLMFSFFEFNPIDVLNSLTFKLKSQSEHICKSCKRKIKHLSSLRANKLKLIQECQELASKSPSGLVSEDNTREVTAKCARID